MADMAALLELAEGLPRTRLEAVSPSGFAVWPVGDSFAREPAGLCRIHQYGRYPIFVNMGSMPYLKVMTPIDIRLRELRKAAGLTQEELAERAGIDQGDISRMESEVSGFTLGVLDRLCEALGCEVGDLIVRKPSKRTSTGAQVLKARLKSTTIINDPNVRWLKTGQEYEAEWSPKMTSPRRVLLIHPDKPETYVELRYRDVEIVVQPKKRRR